MTDIRDITEKLFAAENLTRDEIICLLENQTTELQSYLAEKASATARKYYGNKVFV